MIPAVAAAVIGVAIFAGGIATAAFLPTDPPVEAPAVQVQAAPMWFSYAILATSSFTAVAVCFVAAMLYALKEAIK